MNYISLYRKYRPLLFKDVLGQDEIVISLQNSIKANNFIHAYIFSGPRGTGKTSVAKIFARTINCENKDGIEACQKCNSCVENFTNSSLDIIEIDAASNNGVDEIRDLNQKIQIMPNISKYKIYIIDEVHMLSNAAFNALLKTLEEPPKHIIFILATTEVYKIPLTILSRCQRFNFSLINMQVIIDNLIIILNQQKINFEIDAVKQVASLADGSMRDALSILEQIISYNNNFSLENVTKSFKLLTITEKNIFIESYLSDNVENIYKIKEKIINKSININLFLIEIIKMLKEKIENLLFSNNNTDKLMNLLEKVLKYNNFINNVKDPVLYFELFILNMINECQKNTLKTKGIDIIDKLKNQSATILSNNAVLTKNLPKMPELLEKKELNKVQKEIINDKKTLSLTEIKFQEIQKWELSKNIYNLKVNISYFQFIIAKPNDIIKRNNIIDKIKKLTSDIFLYFYGSKSLYFSENGLIFLFSNQDDANFLNFSLHKKVTRENIFTKLAIKKCIILGLTIEQFKTIQKNSLLINQNNDFKINIDDYYDNLYDSVKTNKQIINEIFGDIQIIK